MDGERYHLYFGPLKIGVVAESEWGFPTYGVPSPMSRGCPAHSLLIPRPGQINAWDNEDFVEAIKKTGRRQLIIAGL